MARSRGNKFPAQVDAIWKVMRDMDISLSNGAVDFGINLTRLHRIRIGCAEISLSEAYRIEKAYGQKIFTEEFFESHTRDALEVFNERRKRWSDGTRRNNSVESYSSPIVSMEDVTPKERSLPDMCS